MKKIELKVIPNAKKDEIKKEGGLLKVYIKKPAIKGKANNALIKLLADYFLSFFLPSGESNTIFSYFKIISKQFY